MRLFILRSAHDSDKFAEESCAGIAYFPEIQKGLESAFFEIDGFDRAEFMAAITANAGKIIDFFAWCQVRVDRRR
jgi:hypothetical protein